MAQPSSSSRPEWWRQIWESIHGRGSNPPPVEPSKRVVHFPWPPGSAIEISLAPLPSGWHIYFQGSAPSQQGIQTDLKIDDIPAHSQVVFEVHHGTGYVIALSEADLVRISYAQADYPFAQGGMQLNLKHANHLELIGGPALMRQATLDQVSIDSGSISGEMKAGRLCVVGNISSVDAGTKIEIRELDLAAGATLAVNGRLLLEKVTVAEGCGGTAAVTLLNQRSHSTIRTNQIIDCRLDVGGGVEIAIVNEGRNLSMAGPGNVTFLEGSVGRNIELRGINLAVERHAILLGLKGEASVQRARDAHLVSSRSEIFTIVLASNASEKPFERATLQGIKVPSTTKGRQQLSALEDAWHFTPYIADLPVWSWRYRRPFAASFWRSDRLNFVTLADEREHIRSLTKLAATKGAPGSVRTKLAWAAYRIHNLTALSTPERALLSLYRTIGYGERGLPAVATWLLVALLVIPIGHGFDLELSRNGLETLMRTWWSYVLSPLYLLNLAGRAEPLGARELIARILVAVPFVTAVIAARKYVKSDREAA